MPDSGIDIRAPVTGLLVRLAEGVLPVTIDRPENPKLPDHSSAGRDRRRDGVGSHPIRGSRRCGVGPRLTSPRRSIERFGIRLRDGFHPVEPAIRSSAESE